jgi:hypothetical protein
MWKFVECVDDRCDRAAWNLRDFISNLHAKFVIFGVVAIKTDRYADA